jgi:histone H2B
MISAAEGRKKKPKSIYTHREDNIEIYIYRVLKQVHPEIGINKKAMQSVNSMVLELYQRLSKSASEVSRAHKQISLNA